MELLTEEQVRLTIVGLFVVVLVIVAKYLEYRELKNRHQQIKAKITNEGKKEKVD